MSVTASPYQQTFTNGAPFATGQMLLNPEDSGYFNKKIDTYRDYVDNTYNIVGLDTRISGKRIVIQTVASNTPVNAIIILPPSCENNGCRFTLDLIASNAGDSFLIQSQLSSQSPSALGMFFASVNTSAGVAAGQTLTTNGVSNLRLLALSAAPTAGSTTTHLRIQSGGYAWRIVGSTVHPVTDS